MSNAFKNPGFAGVFRKQLAEGWNDPANVFGKGNPNGTPHGTDDNKGIGDKTIAPVTDKDGKGAPNGYPHGKGSGELPDKRATPCDPDGKGSPYGQPNGVKPHTTPDGAPEGDKKQAASPENNEETFANKRGKVNEAVEAFRAIVAGLNEAELAEFKAATA